jgi:archaemetzincin
MQKILCLLSVLVILQGCNNRPSGNASTVADAGPVVQIQKQVCLLPYQGFDTGLLPSLQQQITEFYHCPIRALPVQPLPRFAYYAPRNRYKADSLLAYQKQMANNQIIIGLTHQDISTSNDTVADWGVFGLGYCPGQACVISTWRLKRASNNKQQLQERLSKVVLHELGHNLGLPHCMGNQSTCLMNDAKGTMAQVDRERLWLCGPCRQQLP